MWPLIPHFYLAGRPALSNWGGRGGSWSLGEEGGREPSIHYSACYCLVVPTGRLCNPRAPKIRNSIGPWHSFFRSQGNQRASTREYSQYSTSSGIIRVFNLDDAVKTISSSAPPLLEAHQPRYSHHPFAFSVPSSSSVRPLNVPLPHRRLHSPMSTA